MMELWVTLPEDFADRVAAFRNSLEKEGSLPASGTLSWDAARNELVMGERRAPIPVASNQSVICEALFNLPQGQWLEDIDVRRNFYKSTETSMSSAVRALNVAAAKGFGIDNVFEFSRDKARIRVENLTQKN